MGWFSDIVSAVTSPVTTVVNAIAPNSVIAKAISPTEAIGSIAGQNANPLDWSVGGVTGSDLANNPILNPIGVLGAAPITSTTGMSYDDQLQAGAGIGGTIGLINTLGGNVLNGSNVAPGAESISNPSVSTTPLPGSTGVTSGPPVPTAPVTSWDKLVAQFPKDPNGSIDWTTTIGTIGVGGSVTDNLWDSLTESGVGGGGGAAGGGAGSNDSALTELLKGYFDYEGRRETLDMQKDLANKYDAYGAPYRQKLSDLYANPSSFLQSKEVTDPIQQSSNIMARSLSTRGNPIGSGNALQAMNDYTANQLFGRLGEEKNRLAGFGGLANYNAAAPGAANNVIAGTGNRYEGYGKNLESLNNIFNPIRYY